MNGICADYQPLTKNDPLVWGLIFYEGNGGLDVKSILATTACCSLFYDMSLNREMINGYWKNKVIELFDIYKDEYVNKVNVAWKELYITYIHRINQIANVCEKLIERTSQSGLGLLDPLRVYLSKPNANSKAQFCYASYLPNGFTFFKLSADNGNIKAMLKVAKLYELGDGTDQNNEEALKYYKLIILAQNDSYEACLKIKDAHAALLKYNEFYDKHKYIFGNAGDGIVRCNIKIANQKK